MEYKKGFKIKPKYVTSIGNVIFTDGTNDVEPNQLTCEAYGYTYNEATGTCTAFDYNTKITNTSDNIYNIVNGELNTTNIGTENTSILGTNNTSSGNNLNVFISGKNHLVDNGLNDSAIIGGSFAQARNQGEVVMGGGGFGTTLSLAQVSYIQQSGNTEDDTEIALLTQYLPTTYIQKVANCIMGFEAHVIGVNTGIGAGTAGEYGYFKLTGGVEFSNGLASTYHVDVHAVVPHGHSGLNLTGTVKDVTATSFSVHVSGLAETYIQWTAEVKLWQNKITQTI
jgi:hypothetical protein